MLLNALTNYLQNQPPPSELPATAAPAAAPDAAKETQQDTGPTLYEVSDRAVMVSAVAAEFDITALNASDLSRFQNRLQEFGLIDSKGINALSLVHTARLNMNEGDETAPINAKAIVDEAFELAAQPGTTYSQRQQIHQLHTLFSNLDSARPH